MSVNVIKKMYDYSYKIDGDSKSCSKELDIQKMSFYLVKKTKR